MNIDPITFQLADLAERAGVSVRTIRYYIQQGLLPAPETRGPGPHYGAEHLDRLQLIKRLQREHLPLAEIRKRLESLPPDEIRRLASESGPGPGLSSARDYVRGVLSEPHQMLRSLSSTLDERAERYEGIASLSSSPLAAREPVERPGSRQARSQWDRIVLAPDVELHVRRPLTREQNKQVERLLDAARDIFDEGVR